MKKLIEYTQSDFQDYDPYIICNESVDLPFFIFPPGSGGAESYFCNLVPLLDNQHMVLFNNYREYFSNKFGGSFNYERLAFEYILMIKKIQPSGPYNLFGWSFGRDARFGGRASIEIERRKNK